jgi:hypothetical protein
MPVHIHPFRAVLYGLVMLTLLFGCASNVHRGGHSTAQAAPKAPSVTPCTPAQEADRQGGACQMLAPVYPTAEPVIACPGRPVAASMFHGQPCCWYPECVYRLRVT